MSSNTPKVSVVMSVYNGAVHLREAIDGVLGQTFGDFELIVVNDGSTDASRQIVESYPDPRIRLVDNDKNMGLPWSLNRGIDEARGELIARQDDDDISLPERFERQTSLLDSDRRIALVGSGWFYIDIDSKIFGEGSLPGDDAAIKSKLRTLRFPHGSFMVRKDLLRSIGSYDPRFVYTQDLDLLLRLAKAGHRFGAVETPLYKLRRNLVSSDFKARCQERFSELAFERYDGDTDMEIPDVLAEVRASTGTESSPNGLLSRYWYGVGNSALANGRRWRAAHYVAKLLRTGDLKASAKLTFKVARAAIKR